MAVTHKLPFIRRRIGQVIGEVHSLDDRGWWCRPSHANDQVVVPCMRAYDVADPICLQVPESTGDRP
jgi:hypothetical protein